MRSRVLIVLGVLLIVMVSFFDLTCKKELPPKDKIIIGAVRSMAGANAVYEQAAFGPIYKMWVKEVNARGGIYVKEYGKKLPVEMKVYDDKSDMGTMTRLLEKLIVEDKVDFVFPPASTAFLFAAAKIASQHEYILLGAEGGATTHEKRLSEVPYLFMILSYSNHYQMPDLADIFEEHGVKSVAILYIDDLHGIEYQGVATNEFMLKGIEIKLLKGSPPDIKDVSHILKEAKRLNVDAFCSFTYPDTSVLVTKQAIELGINFKAFLVGPGGNFEFYRGIFGDANIEGVMGEGGWNAKSSEAAKEFLDLYLKYNPRATLDWWGHLLYWAELQIFEQAIEKAGTLDQKKIRDIIAKEKFDTVLGKTWFENQLMARECYPGQIGQWQKGIYEVIGPKEKSTAEIIFPKPDWPSKK